jgi:uncharacterized protein (DUF1778 family)
VKTLEKSRFDTRLPKEQKEFFEYAATLAGFRTLTDFVISSVQQQADKIVEKHTTILASKRDQEIFFEALINPKGPNDNLKKAAIRHKEFINQK